jgi:hypothetical protein
MKPPARVLSLCATPSKSCIVTGKIASRFVVVVGAALQRAQAEGRILPLNPSYVAPAF